MATLFLNVNNTLQQNLRMLMRGEKHGVENR